jgi:ubiquinone/menaquinone biosynthesis C-methylase UbiE
MRIARVGPGDVFYDLGCGDGRVVIEAAKRGALGVCIEIREDLIKQAIEAARAAGVVDRIRFIHGDFRYVDVSDATVVYMYLLTRVNEALRPKLERELRLGTRVVTLDFEIPGWKPIHIEKHHTGGLERTIYLYVRGVSDAV